jgi:tRNA nucleotidyltransferase (CCA-adding enzyme)
LPVRLGALFHDLGKPGAEGDHAERGAALASRALQRLRYPTRLRTYVTSLVQAHADRLAGIDELFARRLLREHGDELALDLVSLKGADLRGKQVPQAELDELNRLRSLLQEQRAAPHSLADLAVDGSDLIELGYVEGPELGRALESLLDLVVERPELNTRDQLLERARSLRS